MTGDNGWTGGDPRLRFLRTIASIVVLGLLVWIVADHRSDIATFGTLVGALLILLGFETGVRWPGPRP